MSWGRTADFTWGSDFVHLGRIVTKQDECIHQALDLIFRARINKTLGAKDRCHDEGLFQSFASFALERIKQESGSKILRCGDGSCWKAFKPIAS
ncbi:hypothetical protein Tco_1182440 [Tanacetum coccineum]